MTPVLPVSTTADNVPLTNAEVDANFKSLNDELVLKATAVYADSQALAMAIALG